MTLIKYFLLTIFSLLLAFHSIAQPRLVQLETNGVLRSYLKKHPALITRKITTADTLTLPFFDDFSKTRIYPDSLNWIDNFVYINSGLAKNAPSIGVATFDAMNFDGTMYSTANTNSFIADYLTSRPIKFDSLKTDTTIFFSFAYEAGGNGDVPETKDSLILEFYSPLDSMWREVWHATGGNVDTIFKKVIFQISDTNYLQNGFQFRFKNTASLSSAPMIDGKKGNCDYWNLDWVYLNDKRNINDTIFSDVAINYFSNGLLASTGYKEIPWPHYSSGFISTSGPSLYMNAYNYKISDTANVSHYIKILNNKTSSSIYYQMMGALNIYPDSNNFYESALISNPIIQDNEDSASFKFYDYINYDVDDATKFYRWNDTVKYDQHFYNYYAYDDGISENGFGIDGLQTSNAKVAVKYHTLKTDTLRGVQIYFNHSLYDQNQVYFYLTVWAYDNSPSVNKPSVVLYQAESARVEFTDSLDEYYIYRIDTPIVVSGDFCIGWKQNTEAFLNVGFDIDNDNCDKTFWNVYGDWQVSPFPGTVMMRPMFGKVLPTGITEKPKTSGNITLYPNPANDKLYIQTKEHINRIEIFDSYGKLVCQNTNPDNVVSLESTPAGFYIVKTYTNNSFFTHKLIIKK